MAIAASTLVPFTSIVDRLFAGAFELAPSLFIVSRLRHCRSESPSTFDRRAHGSENLCSVPQKTLQQYLSSTHQQHLLLKQEAAN